MWVFPGELSCKFPWLKSTLAKTHLVSPSFPKFPIEHRSKIIIQVSPQKKQVFRKSSWWFFINPFQEYATLKFRQVPQKLGVKNFPRLLAPQKTAPKTGAFALPRPNRSPKPYRCPGFQSWFCSGWLDFPPPKKGWIGNGPFFLFGSFYMAICGKFMNLNKGI